jgi:hypothetical protein
MCAVVVLESGAQITSCLQEQHSYILMTNLACSVKWCIAVVAPHFRICSEFQQRLNAGELAMLCGQVQGGVPILSLGIDVWKVAWVKRPACVLHHLDISVNGSMKSSATLPVPSAELLFPGTATSRRKVHGACNMWYCVLPEPQALTRVQVPDEDRRARSNSSALR